jgi:hypothetical protein
MVVSALIRRIEAAGGHAMVLAKGDPTAGALLVQLAERGIAGPLVERAPGMDGYSWREVGTGDAAGYIARRRRSDPDLWVIELDHPDARAILTETVG